MEEKRTRKKVKRSTESWKTPDNIAAAKEMFLDTQIIPSTFEIGKVCKLISDSYTTFYY